MNYDDVMASKQAGTPLNLPPMSPGNVPPMPPELEELGSQVQAKEDEAMAAASPQGDFHSRALNQLVDALNRVLPLFGADPYASFEGDVQVLPPDFTRLLMMVKQAASDSGNDPGIDLASVRTDRDLMMLAGKLAALAKDKDFAAFLKQPATAKPQKKPDTKMNPFKNDEGEHETESMPGPADSDMDALFSSRS